MVQRLVWKVVWSKQTSFFTIYFSLTAIPECIENNKFFINFMKQICHPFGLREMFCCLKVLSNPFDSQFLLLSISVIFIYLINVHYKYRKHDVNMISEALYQLKQPSLFQRIKVILNILIITQVLTTFIYTQYKKYKWNKNHKKYSYKTVEF